MPKGLTTTASVSIIAIAIVIVGIAIYLVYTQTMTQDNVITIQMDDSVSIEEGTSKSISGVLESHDTTSNITLTASQSNAVITQLSGSTFFSGDEFILTLSGRFFSDEIITVTATQRGISTTFSLSVNVFSPANNSNTTSNTNNTINTNTTSNTNSATQAGTLIDGSLNFTMEYPVEWGTIVESTLQTLKPIEGDIRLIFFENLDRIDIPGFVYITGATTNYVPEKSAGTKLWFSAKISPTSSLDTIEEQITAAGFIPLQIEKVKIGNIDAVRMINYRGYYHHYLDITYLFPYDTRETYDTLFIARSLAIITEESEMPLEQVLEEARVLVTKIEERNASDDVLLRYDQFEEAITTLRFIQ